MVALVAGGAVAAVAWGALAQAQPARRGAPPAPGLTIRFFDVGQGDAALVVSPTGKKLLIDAGPAETFVADRLGTMGIDTIDLAVASHNHADHIGGFAAVLNRIVVRNYMENGVPATTATYNRVLSALEHRRVPVLRATPRTIDLGGGATVAVLPMSDAEKEQNNRTVGLLVRYGRFNALFAGDAEGKERTLWLATAGLPRVQLLKVAHHGSVNGTDARFLDALDPCLAIISVGANTYGHPSAAVMALLTAHHARPTRTDQAGDVIVQVSALGVVSVQTTHSARADTLRCAA